MAEKRPYRLLVGGHLVADESRPYTDEVAKLRPMIPYNADGSGAGNIIYSDIDLCRKFNSPDPTFPKKFDYVTDTVAPNNAPITMEELLKRGISHEALLAAMEKETGHAHTASAANPPPAVDPVQAAAQAGFGTLHTDKARYPQTPPQPLQHGGDIFETMSDDELRKHAEQEEIPLPAKAKREQILKAVRAAEIQMSR